MNKSGDGLLSHGIHRSTIGAGRLNYRVRNGIGCGPSAMITGNSRSPARRPAGSSHADDLHRNPVTLGSLNPRAAPDPSCGFEAGDILRIGEIDLVVRLES